MAQEGSLRNMCFKTRMCKYFAHGRCTRQHDCAFAHSLSEMRRAPNLACTKLCPKLAETGECHDPTCTFAHERRELRKISLAGAERLPHSGRPQRQQEKDMNDLGFATKSASAPKAHVPPPPVPPLMHHGSFYTDTASTCSGGPVRVSEEVSSSADSSDFGSGANRRARPRRGATGEQLDRKPPPGRDWGARFHKTVMCTFYLKGKCNKGSDCHFAHSEAELQPVPDLSHTKLCARLVNTGSCTDPNCRYAHSREELKGTPPWLARCSRRPAAPAAARREEVGSEIPSTPSSIGEDDGDVHFFPPFDAALAPGVAMDDIPSTPSSIGEEDDAPAFFPQVAPPMQQVMQFVLVAAPVLQADVAVAPPAGTGPVEAAAEAAATAQRASVCFRDEDLPHLAVKNTFLTLEEDDDQSPHVCAPRAKSMPNVFRSSCDDDDDEAFEADVSTEEPASRSPSSSCLDFVDMPLELPKEVLAPIDALQTQVVPVCAVQKVERLVEVPTAIEIDLVDAAKATSRGPSAPTKADPTPAEALALARGGKRRQR